MDRKVLLSKISRFTNNQKLSIKFIWNIAGCPLGQDFTVLEKHFLLKACIERSVETSLDKWY